MCEKWVVYQACCIVSKRRYIGKTCKFERRRTEHADNGSQYHFHRAIRKYERDVFKWKVLSIHRSNATASRMSASQTGRKHSAKTKAKIAASHIGILSSAKTRAKLSAIAKARVRQ